MKQKKPEGSELRRELNAVLKQLQAIVSTLSSRKPPLRGTFYIIRRKCGKKPCSLCEGKLHEAWVFSATENGKKFCAAFEAKKNSLLESLLWSTEGFGVPKFE